MGSKRFLLLILVLICLAAQASSQGYAGTVTTGKGIIPSLRVGSEEVASGVQADLTGVWSLDLLDSKKRHIELDIQKSKDNLAGAGNITADGNSRRVLAAGNISGGNIGLSASVIDSPERYSLQVTRSGTYLAGKYDIYSNGSLIQSGTVRGSIKPKASLDSRPTVILGNYPNQTLPMDVEKMAATEESTLGASNDPNNRIESRDFSTTSNSGHITTSDVSMTANYG